MSERDGERERWIESGREKERDKDREGERERERGRLMLYSTINELILILQRIVLSNFFTEEDQESS